MCITLVLAIAACGEKAFNENLVGVSMKEYYSIEDFQSIVEGESTY